MEFWLDNGIDGFRVDAVPYLLEDGNLTDEPVWDSPGCTESQYACLNHLYTRDQEGSFEAVYEFRDFVDEYTNKVGGDQRYKIISIKYYYKKIINKLLFDLLCSR